MHELYAADHARDHGCNEEDALGLEDRGGRATGALVSISNLGS